MVGQLPHNGPESRVSYALVPSRGCDSLHPTANPQHLGVASGHRIRIRAQFLQQDQTAFCEFIHEPAICSCSAQNAPALPVGHVLYLVQQDRLAHTPIAGGQRRIGRMSGPCFQRGTDFVDEPVSVTDHQGWGTECRSERVMSHRGDQPIRTSGDIGGVLVDSVDFPAGWPANPFDALGTCCESRKLPVRAAPLYGTFGDASGLG